GLAPAMVQRLASAATAAVPVVPLVEPSPETPILAYADAEANRKPKQSITPLQSLYFSGLSIVVFAALAGGALLVFYATMFGQSIKTAKGLREETGSIV